MDFMKHEAVEAAWLNHEGTIIAVVWKVEAINKEEVASNVFTINKQEVIELTGDLKREQIIQFKTGKWYSGSDVDQLSMIEAVRITDQLLSWMEDEEGITNENKKTLRDEFESYIKNEFLAITDADVINHSSYWERWEKELTAIGVRLLGKDMMEVLIVSTKMFELCKTNQTCCTKDGTSSCCKKSN